MICNTFKVILFLFFKQAKHLKTAMTIFQIVSDTSVTIYLYIYIDLIEYDAELQLQLD